MDDSTDTQIEKHADKKFKTGVIYLDYIPDGLNVDLLRQIMSHFGEVARIYLEPEGKDLKRHKYTEGWVEFRKKVIAKKVAKVLNGTELNFGKKRCKLNGQVWSIKYLNRFKWHHLTEQLTYDRKVKEQQTRFDTAQAKKEADFFESVLIKRKKGKEISKTKGYKFKQKSPIVKPSVDIDDDLLRSIFKKTNAAK